MAACCEVAVVCVCYFASVELKFFLCFISCPLFSMSFFMLINTTVFALIQFSVQLLQNPCVKVLGAPPLHRPSHGLVVVSPMKLIGKPSTLGLSTTLCNWILDFHTNRTQSVFIGSPTSSTLMLNIGAPQGCVLSPLLFTLYTHNCNP